MNEKSANICFYSETIEFFGFRGKGHYEIDSLNEYLFYFFPESRLTNT